MIILNRILNLHPLLLASNEYYIIGFNKLSIKKYSLIMKH